MSIIICKHCGNHIDTDFNAEHEEECLNEEPYVSIEGTLWDLLGSQYDIPKVMDFIKIYVDKAISTAKAERTKEIIEYIDDNIIRFIGDDWSEEDRFGSLKIVLEEAKNLPDND